MLLSSVVPYAKFLGLSMELLEDGTCMGRLRYADHLIGDSSIPALHGGTLAALLESTAIFTALFATEGSAIARTITLTIDYLRSGRAQDSTCTAKIVRAGRRILVVQVSAFQDDPDKPISTATVHLLVA